MSWIGDSSVVECRGWGGQIRAINPDFEMGADRDGARSLPMGPIINGGMMDVNGGWMGAGSTRMPMTCFED